LEHPAVGGDDLGADDRIDREPEPAAEEADAAAERDPADADAAGVAEAGGEAVPGQGAGVVARGEPGAGPARAAPPAPHRPLAAGPGRGGEGVRDVRAVRRPDGDGGAGLDAAVEEVACL